MRPSSSSRASVLLAAALLSACPGGEPSPAPPRAGGTVRIGYPEEPSLLSPVDGPPPAADFLRAVLPSFHVVTPELRYRPSLLAAEPEVVNTGERQEVRFRLRQARWSDGTPITVEDVAFTWRTMREAGADGFAYVADVVEDSATRGRLILDPPYAGWRDLFSAGRFVLPAHTGIPVGEWIEGPPVSGGPFEIEGWERGRSITLRRNERHRPRARLDRIVIEIVPDATTAVQLLAAGELDAVAPMLGVSWSRRLARIRGVDVSRRYGPHLVHLLFNLERVPSEPQRVQLADAIDRSRFAEVVLGREGRRADGVLSPEQPGSVQAWAAYGRGAPAQLASDDELTLAYPEGEVLEALARYVQAEVERAGGDVDLVALDADVFSEEWLRDGSFDLALWETRSGPESWLSRWFRTGSPANPGRNRDQVLDGLLGASDLGGPQGADALGRIQQVLAERLLVLPMFQPRTAMGSRGVEGVEANPTADGPLWNAGSWSLARAARPAAA